MNGYVINKTSGWRHALKRNIGPGQKVSLDELFEQYGEKHEIQEGTPFVEWLRSIKLSDTEVWGITYEGETSVEDAKPQKSAKIKTTEKKENKPKTETEEAMPIVAKGLDVNEIANLSVRKARETLPKFTDLKMLKYALNHANQLADKDTLCRMLRKRITVLELSRR